MSKQIGNPLDYGSAISALEKARQPYMITTQDDHLIDVASKLEAWKKKILTSTSNAERAKLEIDNLKSQQQTLKLESERLVKVKTETALTVSEKREDLKAKLEEAQAVTRDIKAAEARKKSIEAHQLLTEEEKQSVEKDIQDTIENIDTYVSLKESIEQSRKNLEESIPEDISKVHKAASDLKEQRLNDLNSKMTTLSQEMLQSAEEIKLLSKRNDNFKQLVKQKSIMNTEGREDLKKFLNIYARSIEEAASQSSQSQNNNPLAKIKPGDIKRIINKDMRQKYNFKVFPDIDNEESASKGWFSFLSKSLTLPALDEVIKQTPDNESIYKEKCRAMLEAQEAFDQAYAESMKITIDLKNKKDAQKYKIAENLREIKESWSAKLEDDKQEITTLSSQLGSNFNELKDYEDRYEDVGDMINKSVQQKARLESELSFVDEKNKGVLLVEQDRIIDQLRSRENLLQNEIKCTRKQLAEAVAYDQVGERLQHNNLAALKHNIDKQGLIEKKLSVYNTIQSYSKDVAEYEKWESNYKDAKIVLDTMVIPPFLVNLISRGHAAIASFCLGVIPPMAIFGLSLL